MLSDLAVRHLALRLRPVNRALQAAVQRQAELAARLVRPDIAHLCITDDQVQVLLRDADAMLDVAAAAMPAVCATSEELGQEAALRAEAEVAGAELPLDALARLRGLSTFEQLALLLCAAPEIDRCYERIYGYVLDDMNRRSPCPELVCMIGGGTLPERLANARALAPYGTLRRSGMLAAVGDASLERRQELRLAPGLFQCLCGIGTPQAFHDPAEVDCRVACASDPHEKQLAALGAGVSSGAIAIVGVWGTVHSDPADAARRLANAAGMPLRRLPAGDDPLAALHGALDAAAALGALLWIETDSLPDGPDTRRRERIAAALGASSVPLVLSGAAPWRPIPLLAARAYAELRLPAPDYEARKRLWGSALPDVAPSVLEQLAGRYRAGATAVRAAVLAARAAAGVVPDTGDAVAKHVDSACATVLRPASQRYITMVEPRRGPAELVLPEALHRQVLDVAAFFRAWPRVADQWGFGRVGTGRGGIKALFAGDSGTGKTLAAEVVAGQLGMPLLKIDLAQVVSKWVGETEKNLEAVFSEAEDSHGVLFFDEADALFGKRGEVQHGIDRYANLEVSYLLQRIEDYAGLVILASNLKDNIDGAFTRRFQVIIKFPRPLAAERRRIWEVAFPRHAALEDGVDFDVLARLDLTGAGIASIARTSALLAAAQDCAVIGKTHIVTAIVRQYQLEARVLSAAELGPYAPLMQAVR